MTDVAAVRLIREEDIVCTRSLYGRHFYTPYSSFHGRSNSNVILLYLIEVFSIIISSLDLHELYPTFAYPGRSPIEFYPKDTQTYLSSLSTLFETKGLPFKIFSKSCASRHACLEFRTDVSARAKISCSYAATEERRASSVNDLHLVSISHHP